MTATWQFYGDWDRLRDWTRKRQSGANFEDFEEVLLKLGEAIKTKAIWRMKHRDAAWPPLAASTILRKGHDRPFIDSGLYMDSITVRLVKKSKGVMELQVGPEGLTDDGYSYQDVARWLEYGTSRIPARPLWRPLMQRIPRYPEFRDIMNKMREDMP
jgi:hypothetical protein